MHVSGKDTDIYLGDCLKVMPRLQDKIDLVLVDLPYGVTANKWDTKIEFPLLWQLYKNICSTTATLIFTSMQPFATQIIMSNYEMFHCEWIWIKNCGTGHLNAHNKPMREHENILVFNNRKHVYNPQSEERLNKTAARIIKHTRSRLGPNYHSNNYADSWMSEVKEDRGPRSYQCFNVERGLHPTQKPLDMMEYFIKTYSNPGDIVLDNCMGSGTTGIACQNTGRKFIGIEKSKKYFDIARKELFNDRPSTEYPFPT